MIGAFYIFAGNYFDNARHLFRLCAVDANDGSMTYFSRLNQCYMQGARRHFQLHVIAVVHRTAGLTQCGRPYNRFSVVFLSLVIWLIPNFLYGLFTPHHFCCQHHRIYQLFISGAAADVSVFLEPISDFFPRRRWIFFQQSIGRHNKARCAESALNAAAVNPSCLKGMGLVGRADSFYRCQLTVFFHCFDLLCAGTGSPSR